MNRYIDANKLKERLYVAKEIWSSGGTHPKIVEEDDIDDMPIEDVVPVVHAHWIEIKNAEEMYGMLISNYECSKCHDRVQDTWRFCPNCGAKMDEVRKMKRKKGNS